MARSKCRTMPKNRRGKKLVARQRSNDSEDTMVDAGSEGNKDTGDTTDLPANDHSPKVNEEKRSSPLSSPSSSIAPPSPWLAGRNPPQQNTQPDDSAEKHTIDSKKSKNRRDREENTRISLSQLVSEAPMNPVTGSQSNGTAQAHNKTYNGFGVLKVMPTASRTSRNLPPLRPVTQGFVPASSQSIDSQRQPVRQQSSAALELPLGLHPTNTGPPPGGLRAAQSSIALASPEQQREIASRVVHHVQPRLTPIDKVPLLVVRDVRKASEGYWKSLSFMDAMTPTVTVDSYFMPHLQMRVAHLWAQNYGSMSYHELVRLLDLPPGYLTYWIRKWAHLV